LQGSCFAARPKTLTVSANRRETLWSSFASSVCLLLKGRFFVQRVGVALAKACQSPRRGHH
jgi:hypothetical protein